MFSVVTLSFCHCVISCCYAVSLSACFIYTTHCCLNIFFVTCGSAYGGLFLIVRFIDQFSAGQEVAQWWGKVISILAIALADDVGTLLSHQEVLRRTTALNETYITSYHLWSIFFLEVTARLPRRCMNL